MRAKAKSLKATAGGAINGLTASAGVKVPVGNGPDGPGGASDAERNGVRRMVEIQRARLLTAMVEVCVEYGAAHVTVAAVVERAGVSRRTFYEVFNDCEECFLAAQGEAMRRASTRVVAARGGSGPWKERIRASLVALLEFIEFEPVMARLLIVESLGGGHAALQRRRCVIEQIIAVVDEGREEPKLAKQPPPLAAEGIVGGVLSILHARLLAHPGMTAPSLPAAVGSSGVEGIPLPENGSLLGLTGSLMSMIVLPYLGSTVANRELRRPAPQPAQTGAPSEGDPLRDIGLRLTYRTVRALVSVAEHPGSSNREIGQAAGITDQGQMSKLLWRLERFGLVHNTGLGAGTGTPNVWTLTKRGQAIHETIVRQVAS